ncbi:MAG: hypothetical protein JST93_01275 [Acidobacteria bacterium]|nr:hypothetical protein [Acidobacteriota bacterium]
MRSLLLLAALCLAPAAHAVSFTLESHTGDVWTYTLEFAPHDNYYPGPATIDLEGLYGVTEATPPTSTTLTSFPEVNLQWNPFILGGGVRVIWVITEGGTGNMVSTRYTYGFSVTAPGAVTGPVRVSTTGFKLDSGQFDLDIQDVVIDGPVHPGRVNDTPEPSAAALFLVGITVIALRRTL